ATPRCGLVRSVWSSPLRLQSNAIPAAPHSFPTRRSSDLMHGFRPQADARYLERRRLLDRLPDEPGYVVWLEAPYGYGKSVLTSQWARELEDGGWSVVWLSGR